MDGHNLFSVFMFFFFRDQLGFGFFASGFEERRRACIEQAFLQLARRRSAHGLVGAGVRLPRREGSDQLPQQVLLEALLRTKTG